MPSLTLCHPGGFAVDPLFHKISAQFDEGGPASMLMYNLPLSGDCQLVFDSSAAIVGNARFFCASNPAQFSTPLDLSDLPGACRAGWQAGW